GAINQTLFEQDLNQFLSSNYTLPTSDQAPPVIMLSELYPTVKLMSDMERYQLDQYQRHYSRAATKPRANAVTSDCKPRYIQAKANNTCSVLEGEDEAKGVCIAEPTFNWDHRTDSVVYSRVTPAANQKKQVSGPVAILGDFYDKDGITYYQGERIKLQQVAVATPIGSAVLEPTQPRIKIDLQEGDRKAIIISPERFSTQYLAGRLNTIVISAPKEAGSEAFIEETIIPYDPFREFHAMYGTTMAPIIQKKQKMQVLPLHENTQKHITKPTCYNIDLTASQEQSILIGLGSRVVITEKDAKKPLKTASTVSTSSVAPDNLTLNQEQTATSQSQSALRAGFYRLSYFPTHTTAEKNKILEDLKNKISAIKQKNSEQSERVATYRIVKKVEEPLQSGSACAAQEPWWSWFYENYHGVIADCQARAKARVAYANEIINEQDNRDHALKANEKMLIREQELQPYDNKQLKIKIKKAASTTGNGQDFTIQVGNAKTDAELKKTRYVDLFTYATVEIRDCQRDILLS
ncbi:MAG: hypothetical protein ACRC1U_05390, partial [Vibrionaceae bacterium]